MSLYDKWGKILTKAYDEIVFLSCYISMFQNHICLFISMIKMFSPNVWPMYHLSDTNIWEMYLNNNSDMGFSDKSQQ